MRQFYTLIASILLSSSMLHAQAIQTFSWKAGIGGTGNEKASDMLALLINTAFAK